MAAERASVPSVARVGSPASVTAVAARTASAMAQGRSRPCATPPRRTATRASAVGSSRSMRPPGANTHSGEQSYRAPVVFGSVYVTARLCRCVTAGSVDTSRSELSALPCRKVRANSRVLRVRGTWLRTQTHPYSLRQPCSASGSSAATQRPCDVRTVADSSRAGDSACGAGGVHALGDRHVATVIAPFPNNSPLQSGHTAALSLLYQQAPGDIRHASTAGSGNARSSFDRTRSRHALWTFRVAAVTPSRCGATAPRA